MFIRFVVGTDGEHHRWLTGIVTEARLLRDSGQLSLHEETSLEDAYAWLNAHLPCPPFSTSGWGPEAISWFKDTAGPSIQKMWEIVRSKNPGKILYEDDFQVVVREWVRL